MQTHWAELIIGSGQTMYVLGEKNFLIFIYQRILCLFIYVINIMLLFYIESHG